MIVTRRVTFRLYPKPAQERKLYEWRRLHCYLYNSALADRKDSYQRLGKSIGYFDQQNRLPEFKTLWTEFVELGSQTLQATLKRVDFAFQRFFKGLGGYPRFQSIRTYPGWTYPAISGWKAHTAGDNGYLRLSNLGQIQMRGKARTWGTPTSCTIGYRHGKWYASITVKCEPVRETGTGEIGIDFGTLTAIAMSDGAEVENPRHLAKTQAAIRKVSKAKRRKRAPNRKKKIKASRRWKKAQARVSKLTRKAARQRLDLAHKRTTEIVSINSLVVTEKLNIKGMTRKAKKGKRKRQKSGLNRSILDVGWGMMRGMLEYKEVEANGVYLEAPTQQLKPSQRCPECWNVKPKTLDERIHSCSCGCREDRDVASARVCLIWARGLERASLDADQPSSTSSPKYTGGFKQLAEMKRQKPQPS
ncbi:MAG TPA: transposase [Allocoleopsis sp.]